MGRSKGKGEERAEEMSDELLGINQISLKDRASPATLLRPSRGFCQQGKAQKVAIHPCLLLLCPCTHP